METQENNTWAQGHVDPWWGTSHRDLPYANEVFNDAKSLREWRSLGYTQKRFTGDMYDNADTYDIEDYLGSFPTTAQTTLPEFGDSQIFPGSIRLVRAIDVEVLNYMINLPSTQFTETNNPTYVSGPKKMTEVALLNENKEALVIAKCAKPITRSGTQVFSVRLDF